MPGRGGKDGREPKVVGLAGFDPDAADASWQMLPSLMIPKGAWSGHDGQASKQITPACFVRVEGRDDSSSHPL